MVRKLYIYCFTLVVLVNSNIAISYTDAPSRYLEEIFITAQKHEQPLQQTPIAISVLTDKYLDTQGITSLDGLMDSIYPSLNIVPAGNSPSSLSVVTRGGGVPDLAQPFRQSSTAIYIDDVYLSRPQGLSLDLADIQQIEILRGPQGTLFGRNSTAGALHITSKKPTGKFGVTQVITTGNYNFKRSVTRINLPAISGVSTKIDYIHSERDGWVKNSLSGQADYNEHNKDGGRFNIHWQPKENFSLNYLFDQSDIQTAQVYFQLWDDNPGVLGAERKREKKTRFDAVLDPVDVDATGHSISINWVIYDNLKFKSISSARKLDEDGFNNYLGTLYAGGLVINEDLKQEQLSQEFQFIGSINDKLDWVAGLYYLKEDIDFDIQFLSALDNNFNAVIPPAGTAITTFVGDTQSEAVYAQGTWNFTKQWGITTGIRFTQDKKQASREGISSQAINSDHTDMLMALNYNLNEDISAYLKWSTAYRAGGYNVRSVSFLPYNEEKNKTVEVGLKSEWFDHRARLNIVVFSSSTKDNQFDFIDPSNTLIVETLNAERNVGINGTEVEFSAILNSRLLVGLNYSYLDADRLLQPHPDGSGATQEFELIQAPGHAGTLAIDYTTTQLAIGTLAARIELVSKDGFNFSTTPDSRQDGYSLLNASLTLNWIGDNNFKVTLWGKNITDEEYARIAFPIGDPAVTVIQAFGTPRTVGINASYEF